MLQSYWSGMDEMEACIWCSCPMRMCDQDLKGQGGSDLQGGQDKGSKVKLIRTCKKEVHRCLNEEDMVHPQLTKDMTLDRRIWRTRIRVEL
ncbi:hypothetical protein H5410_035824 [Solanum commersonii]|uniref:Uncharacterized protein n=1 Tax=Solanum commersonii TaxID=4109 RepID=A0A9J5Y4S7_SOLCO|nr:hypothetical protein H5410_035824 [Solanum commersonii]